MSSTIDTMTIEVEQPPTGGHPPGLKWLFLSEMWERFCYYGMRALLTLYLIKSLMKGDNEAFAIYGTFTALVYAAPVLGGRIADHILGYRIAVILGGILMAIGEFMILGGTEHWLYVGMGTIIVGNGYFKANISSIVGKLYADGDPRRDSGFTIFYIGINIGALLATLVCAEVGEKFGYHYGFALAGFGMLLGILFFVFGQSTFKHVTDPPNPTKLHGPYLGPLTLFHTTVIASLLVIPVLYFLLLFNQVVGILLAAIAAYVIFSLMSRGIKEGHVLRDRMIVFIILMFFNIVFWACFEQAGTSLTLFADRNVDRDMNLPIIGEYTMGAATTQFFNPLFIIIMGSIFSMLWVYLNRINKNPNIPVKFGLGIILLGLGYLVVEITPLSPIYLVPLWTLALLYFLHTTGELFISPIGLSMVTKLVPKDMTGTAMGAWFLSFAGANYVAALIAMATGVDKGAELPEIETNYQQRLELIETNTELLAQRSQELEAATFELERSLQADAQATDEMRSLPGELREMTSTLHPSMHLVNAGLMPLFRDTTSAEVPKHIRFDRLSETYLGAVRTLNMNLDTLISTMGMITAGAGNVESNRDKLASTVVGVGSSFDVIRADIYDELRGRRAEEDPFLSSTDQGITEFRTSSSTAVSHMYWLTYHRVYITIGLITVAIGLLLLLVSKPLNRMMHGVR